MPGSWIPISFYNILFIDYCVCVWGGGVYMCHGAQTEGAATLWSRFSPSTFNQVPGIELRPVCQMLHPPPTPPPATSPAQHLWGTIICFLFTDRQRLAAPRCIGEHVSWVTAISTNFEWRLSLLMSPFISTRAFWSSTGCLFYSEGPLNIHHHHRHTP